MPTTTAEKLSQLERDIERSISSTQVDVEERVAKVVESAHFHSVDHMWSPVDSLYKAMAMRDIYVQVAYVAEQSMTDYPLTEALGKVAEQMRKALLTNRWTGTSTSALSNYADQTRCEVASRWLDTAEYFESTFAGAFD